MAFPADEVTAVGSLAVGLVGVVAGIVATVTAHRLAVKERSAIYRTAIYERQLDAFRVVFPVLAEIHARTTVFLRESPRGSSDLEEWDAILRSLDEILNRNPAELILFSGDVIGAISEYTKAVRDAKKDLPHAEMSDRNAIAGVLLTAYMNILMKAREMIGVDRLTAAASGIFLNSS